MKKSLIRNGLIDVDDLPDEYNFKNNPVSNEISKYITAHELNTLNNFEKTQKYLKRKYDLTVFKKELNLNALNNIKENFSKADKLKMNKNYIILGRSHSKGISFELSIKGWTDKEYLGHDYFIPYLIYD